MKLSGKIAAMVTVLAAATAALSITAFAGTWQQNSKGWWYQNEDGSNPAAEWVWIDSNHDGEAEMYYFDDNGYLVTNTTTEDGYTVNKDGAWVKSNIVQTQYYEVAGINAKTAAELSKIKGTWNSKEFFVGDQNYKDNGSAKLKVTNGVLILKDENGSSELLYTDITDSTNKDAETKYDLVLYVLGQKDTFLFFERSSNVLCLCSEDDGKPVYIYFSRI